MHIFVNLSSVCVCMISFWSALHPRLLRRADDPHFMESETQKVRQLQTKVCSWSDTKLIARKGGVRCSASAGEQKGSILLPSPIPYDLVGKAVSTDPQPPPTLCSPGNGRRDLLCLLPGSAPGSSLSPCPWVSALRVAGTEGTLPGVDCPTSPALDPGYGQCRTGSQYGENSAES
jgi:hypothetical protein